MPRLAFYTFGLLVSPPDDPAVQGFVDRVQGVLDASHAAPGFVAGMRDMEIHPPFTPWAIPSYVDPALDPCAVATISVWEDLESVFAFAYGGRHAESLRHRHDWFAPIKWPNYCAWWVEDGHVPDYAEAVGRAALLQGHGPTPAAFDFRTAFDAEGTPVRLDRVRAAALRELIPG